MPSWNIHTAHVERLLDEYDCDTLGIADANAFLFGNYVPDIYVGFMVPDATYRIDYCLTHLAVPNVIPVPDAHLFWDNYIFRRWRESPADISLALGAWAHLVADCIYNGNFRTFCETHDVPSGEELRKRKQADFDAFGHSLGIASHVEPTPDLLGIARAFRPYSILPDDVARSIEVADAIVDEARPDAKPLRYQLLTKEWLADSFEDCHHFLASWLVAGNRLQQEGKGISSAEVSREAGLLKQTRGAAFEGKPSGGRGALQ